MFLGLRVGCSTIPAVRSALRTRALLLFRTRPRYDEPRGCAGVNEAPATLGGRRPGFPPPTVFKIPRYPPAQSNRARWPLGLSLRCTGEAPQKALHPLPIDETSSAILGRSAQTGSGRLPTRVARSAHAAGRLPWLIMVWAQSERCDPSLWLNGFHIVR